MVHELGHALGLSHQHSRYDRDTYVTVLFENIQSGKAGNFVKWSVPHNYSVPYDLTSVMHYGPKFCSKNGLYTMHAKNAIYEHLVGRSKNGMSHRDKHIANAMYECAADCSSPPTCKNGGFVNEDCTCVCPPNTSGDKCETSNDSYYGDIDCGDPDVTEEGTITSPNYPGKFPKNVVCWWIIKAPKGKRVRVTITDMKMLYRYKNGICLWDWLAIRYTGDYYTDDVKACSSELQGKSFTSADNQFIMKFKSGSYGWYRGFSANVKFVA